MSGAVLQSEPVAQRARGAVRLGFGAAGVQELHQMGCGRCLLPRSYGAVPTAVVVNMAGGLTGGDGFALEAAVEPDARLVVTTQAAERIYRSIGGAAEISNRLRVGAGAALHWLPQETILFDHAGLARRLEVDLSADARFLGMETLVLGRRAMGEAVSHAEITDHWRIRRGGQLLHAEALRLGGDIGKLSPNRALLDGARAVATLVNVAPQAEALLETARALLPFNGVRAAASAWNGRLVVRWIAQDLMPLKAAQARFLAGFPEAAVPRVWQI